MQRLLYYITLRRQFQGILVSQEVPSKVKSLNSLRSYVHSGLLAHQWALQQSRIATEEQMQTERETLRNASLRSNRLSQAVISAAQVVDSYERLFVAGRRSWQEVLNALREYNDFQLAHTDSQFETMLNIWRLRVRSADTIEGDFLASR